MGVLKQFRYKLNNKWLYPRVKMYSLYKRDLWGLITLRRRYKFRKVVYRMLRRRRRVGRRITEEIYKGFQAKRRKRGFRFLVHITKMRLTEYYHNIKEYQYGLIGRRSYKQQGLWDSNFWALLEFRLDTLLVKCNFFNNQVAARQYIRFNNIYVNAKRIRYANYVCSVGDVISVGQVPLLNPYLDSFTFDRYYKGHYIVDLFPNFLRTLRELVGGLWIILDAFNIFKKIIKKSRFFADKDRKYSLSEGSFEKNSNKRILYQTEKHNYLSLILKGVLKHKRKLKGSNLKKGKKYRVLNPQFLLHMLLLHFKLQAYRSYEVYSFHALWFWKIRYWRVKRQKRRVAAVNRLLKRGKKYLKFNKKGTRNPFSKKSLLFYKRAGYIVKTGASYFLRRRKPTSIVPKGKTTPLGRYRVARRFKFFKKNVDTRSNNSPIFVLFRYFWFKFYLKFLFILETKILDRWLMGFFLDFFEDFKYFLNYNSNVLLFFNKQNFNDVNFLLRGKNSKYGLTNNLLFNFYLKMNTSLLYTQKKERFVSDYEHDLLLNLNVYSFFFKDLFSFLLNASFFTIDSLYIFIKNFKFYVTFIKKSYYEKKALLKDNIHLRFDKNVLFGFTSFIYFFKLKRELSLNKYFLFYKNKIMLGKSKYNIQFIKRWNKFFLVEDLKYDVLNLLNVSVVNKRSAYVRYGKSFYNSEVIEPLTSLRLQRFSQFYKNFSLPFVKTLSSKILSFIKKKPVRLFYNRFKGYNRRYTKKLKKRYYHYLKKHKQKLKMRLKRLKLRKKKLKKKTNLKKKVLLLSSNKTLRLFGTGVKYNLNRYFIISKYINYIRSIQKLLKGFSKDVHKHQFYFFIYNLNIKLMTWFLKSRTVSVFSKFFVQKSLKYKQIKIKDFLKKKKRIKKKLGFLIYKLKKKRMSYKKRGRMFKRSFKQFKKQMQKLYLIQFKNRKKQIRIKRKNKKKLLFSKKLLKLSKLKLNKRKLFFVRFGKRLLKNNFFFFKKKLLKGLSLNFKTEKVLSKPKLSGVYYFLLNIYQKVTKSTFFFDNLNFYFRLKVPLSNYFVSFIKNFYYSFGSFFFRGSLFNFKRVKFGFRNSLRKNLRLNINGIKDQSVFLFTTSMLSLVEESLGWNMKALFKKTILSTRRYKKRYLFTKDKVFFKRRKKFYFMYHKMKQMAKARFYDKRYYKYIFMKGYPTYFMISYKLMSIIVVRKPSLKMLSYPFFVRPEYLIHSFKRRLFF